MNYFLFLYNIIALFFVLKKLKLNKWFTILNIFCVSFIYLVQNETWFFLILQVSFLFWISNFKNKNTILTIWIISSVLIIFRILNINLNHNIYFIALLLMFCLPFISEKLFFYGLLCFSLPIMNFFLKNNLSHLNHSMMIIVSIFIIILLATAKTDTFRFIEISILSIFLLVLFININISTYNYKISQFSILIIILSILIYYMTDNLHDILICLLPLPPLPLFLILYNLNKSSIFSALFIFLSLIFLIKVTSVLIKSYKITSSFKLLLIFLFIMFNNLVFILGYNL